MVLSLSANTAFADFPRLCRAIAQNNYLPHVFGYRGRRLVYTYGIVVLAVFCGALLILFRGVTDRLIPLYAVGAFLAFTMSQSGMVKHWWKHRGPFWRRKVFVNGLGGFVTGITVVVVLLAKFLQGACITLLFIPFTIVLFVLIRRHYHSVRMLTACKDSVDVVGLGRPPIAVIVVDRWSNITRQGIEFASRLSPDVIGLHVAITEYNEVLQEEWKRYVEKPFRDPARSRPNFTRCLLLTASSLFQSCNSFAIYRKNIPIAILLWSYRSWWRTNGTNTSFTISVPVFWNGSSCPRQ